MILLCNDGTAGGTVADGPWDDVPVQPETSAGNFTRRHRGQGLGVERAESTGRYHMDSNNTLIIGNWLVTKHICENQTRHAASIRTTADLPARIEHAAQAIVHAMKPSGTQDRYGQQKMCLGQVVTNKDCNGAQGGGAYACACFDKAAAANGGQGLKFINHLFDAANALRRLQRLRDDVNATTPQSPQSKSTSSARKNSALAQGTQGR
ncbi:Trypanosomal VSG domain [Trypanosoma vivax]|nr:Trypanosomal VSG domain [Trypanosoma vivax]